MAVVALPALSPDVVSPSDTVRDDVNRFLDGLGELPVSSWLAIGRKLMGDRAALAVRQAAWSDVEAAIEAHRLALPAWQVRDALETAVCLVSRQAPCWSRDDRCQFAATHGAAEAAALALLAREHLRADVVPILYAPFAAFVERTSV